MSSRDIPQHEPYKVFGRAATSMTGRDFQTKFGATNTRAGSRGEQVLFEKLRKKGGWLKPDIPLMCSLKLTGKQSDIDFAIVHGNKILLVDAKMYQQNGGFYWNLGDSPIMHKGLGTYKTSGGKQVKLSRSMIMAKDIISRELPGYTVESIVIFTVDPKNRNSTMPNTTFLTYPGGVKALNDRSGKRFIRKFFRGQKRTEKTVRAENYLKRMVQ